MCIKAFAKQKNKEEHKTIAHITDCLTIPNVQHFNSGFPFDRKCVWEIALEPLLLLNQRYRLCVCIGVFVCRYRQCVYVCIGRVCAFVGIDRVCVCVCVCIGRMYRCVYGSCVCV